MENTPPHNPTGRNQYLQIYEKIASHIQYGHYAFNQMLPTEHELAQQFGVSRPTVAKALNMLKKQGLIDRRAGFGTFVSKQIENQSRNVGLIFPGLGTVEVLEPISRAIATNAHQQGFNLHLTASVYTDCDKRALTQSLCQQCIAQALDGVFFSPLNHSEGCFEFNLSILNQLVTAGIQVILIDHDVVSWPRQSNCDLVGIDNMQAGFLVADHILAQSCQKIIFAHPSHEHEGTAKLRQMGCREAVLQAGLDESKFVTVAVDPEYLNEAIQTIKTSQADGLICADDALAAVLLRTLLDHGVKIPEELRVAAFDDVRYASLLSVPLTSYHQPCTEIGYQAAHLMRMRLQHPQRPPRRVTLNGELVIRRSSCTCEKKQELQRLRA